MRPREKGTISDMPAESLLHDARWLFVTSVVFILFCTWLWIFAFAWVFPHAWRFWGIVWGLLWGLTAAIGGEGALRSVFAWWSTPFRFLAETLSLPASGVLFAALALVLGLALGQLFAYTGILFRITRD